MSTNEGNLVYGLGHPIREAVHKECVCKTCYHLGDMCKGFNKTFTRYNSNGVVVFDPKQTLPAGRRVQTACDGHTKIPKTSKTENKMKSLFNNYPVDKTYSQMVADLAKPGSDILASLNASMCHKIHMIVGLSGEFFELQETTDPKHFLEESGDFFFYFDGLRQGYFVKAEELDKPEYMLGIDIPAGQVFACFGSAVGNLIDLVKKEAIYRKDIPEEKIVRQLSVVWQLFSNYLELVNVNIKDVMQANQEKLLTGKNARYAAGTYSDAAAQARADKSAGE